MVRASILVLLLALVACDRASVCKTRGGEPHQQRVFNPVECHIDGQDHAP